MARIYYDRGVDPNVLKGRTVAVIGHGSQGHTHAQNLRDSGVSVVVGLYRGSRSRARAEADGLAVKTVPEAVEAADIVQILVPDEVHAELYRQKIGPHLCPGKALGVSHAFSIHFNHITPPMWMSSWLRPRALATSSAACSWRGRASRVSWPSTRTPRGGRRTSLLPMHGPSAVRGPA